ncbi:hypothetical protein CRUP_019175 [Coryphaenoides rupestris]|nr:hypothetical protein CRUP_019175 [Coryphaenoides rupestris]
MLVARRLVSSFIQIGNNSGQSGLFRRPHGAFPELEPRYLQCTCCWRSRVPVAGFETLNAHLTRTAPCRDADANADDGDLSLDACYTTDQRDAILQTLNHATETELAGVKLLRGRKCVNIVEYRSKHGPFRSLESVVKVPLLKHKSALVVFHSILNPRKKEKEKKVKVQLVKFIKPEVDRAWLELPSADFYLVEKSSISLQNTTLFPVMAHMRTVEAMLFALLEPRVYQTDSNTPPRVLNMMRLAVGRHFGLMIGESRTSGSQVVQQMMTESVTQKMPRLNFPKDLLVKYRNSFQMGRGRGGEEMCNALLQAVAFYEMLHDSS